MKKNMKRISAMILVISVLFLTSCTAIKECVDDYRVISNAIVPDSELNLTSDLIFDFDERIPAQMEERFARMSDLLASNSVIRGVFFLALFNQQASDLAYIADHAGLANLRFYVDPQNNEAREEYLRLNKMYTDLSAQLLAMYRPIYESNFGFLLFGNMEDSQVDKLLALADSYTGEVAELIQERNDLVSLYQQLDSTSSEFLSESAEIYYEIVQINHEIAEQSSYESYAEYAYAVTYSRDYSTTEAKDLHGYVRDYIVPLAKDLYFDIRTTAMENPALAQRLSEELIAVFEKQLTVSSANAEFSEYYALQYDDPDAFIDDWENYSVFGDENSYPIAFTLSLRYYNMPICYFGTGYQGISTLIHEMGHFDASYVTPGGYTSIDLNEVHSQGNEWLYYSYLKEKYQGDEEVYELLIKSKLYEHCLTIILSTACDMFEQRVYAAPETSAVEYDALFEDCIAELNAASILENSISIEPSSYWHLAIISNSMYYLSYAVSLIPSIELHLIAEQEGIERAAECYIALTDGNGEIAFQKALEDAGLSSPFKEDVYVRLSEFFE